MRMLVLGMPGSSPQYQPVLALKHNVIKQLNYCQVISTLPTQEGIADSYLISVLSISHSLEGSGHVFAC